MELVFQMNLVGSLLKEMWDHFLPCLKFYGFLTYSLPKPTTQKQYTRLRQIDQKRSEQ